MAGSASQFAVVSREVSVWAIPAIDVPFAICTRTLDFTCTGAGLVVVVVCDFFEVVVVVCFFVVVVVV
jgi:hypothetical protein